MTEIQCQPASRPRTHQLISQRQTVHFRDLLRSLECTLLAFIDERRLSLSIYCKIFPIGISNLYDIQKNSGSVESVISTVERCTAFGETFDFSVR